MGTSYSVDRIVDLRDPDAFEPLSAFSEEENGEDASDFARSAAREASNDGTTVDVYANNGVAPCWEARYRGGRLVCSGTLEDEMEDLADLLKSNGGSAEERAEAEATLRAAKLVPPSFSDVPLPSGGYVKQNSEEALDWALHAVTTASRIGAALYRSGIDSWDVRVNPSGAARYTVTLTALSLEVGQIEESISWNVTPTEQGKSWKVERA
jgi:hypothetical protein